MCLFKERYLSVLVSVSAELITVKPLHNGHLGDKILNHQILFRKYMVILFQS